MVESKDRTSHMLRVGTAEYGATLFYTLDEPSKAIWDLIDGTRTVSEIVNEATMSGEVTKEDDVYGTLLFFAESGALKSKQDPSPWRRVRIATSFITQVVIIRDSTKILSAIHKVIRPLLRSASLWATMAIALIGVIVYAPRFNATFGDVRNFQLLGSSVVGYLFYNFVILAPIIAIHEIAHAMALLHYSGRSGEIGTGWFYFGPLFYAEVASYWVLPRRQRLIIMWSGNLTTILIGSILVLLELGLPLSPSVHRAFDITAFWCFYGTLWNLAPPFETDGYYLLSDFLKIPNLRQEGFGYLKSTILHLFGRGSPATEGLTRRREATLLGYAIGSIAILGYLGFVSLRFVVYMGADATSWGARLLGLGGSTPALVLVGATSIGYFTLMVIGYGTLIGNQVKKSWVRGLKFEAVHDRNLAVFFYLPSQRTSRNRHFERKVVKLAKEMTPNFSVERRGPLLCAGLGMGSENLPLAQIKRNLRKTEDKFYKSYQKFLEHDGNQGPPLAHLSGEKDRNISTILRDMARHSPPGERADARQALEESIRRLELSVRLVLNSSFSTAWSVETPPAQQYALLEDLLPRTLIEDLTMTNLPGETEEFKRKTIYGLDTIAELATASSTLRDRFSSHPEKFEIVSLFEPVRGRITFVGKTEKIETSLKELGVLFAIHVWSGYIDSLLADTNLNLYAIAQSLPPIPENTAELKDGELFSLNRYVSYLEPLEKNVQEVIEATRETVRPSMEKLKDLKTLFETKGEQRIGEFDAILALNLENIKAIPVRLKDTANMSKTGFEWLRALKDPFGSELKQREERHLDRKRRLVRDYRIFSILSVALVGLGLIQPALGIEIALVAGGLLLQAAYGLAFYISHRSFRKVSRHASVLFSQILPSIYAMTQAVNILIVGMSTLNLGNILSEDKKLVEEKQGTLSLIGHYAKRR